jgi:hypothetical protein
MESKAIKKGTIKIVIAKELKKKHKARPAETCYLVGNWYPDLTSTKMSFEKIPVWIIHPEKLKPMDEKS